MSILVRIPSPLLKLTQNKEEITANGGTIEEVLADIESSYPGIKARICDEKGALRKFINIYLNEEDIRFINGEKSAVKDGDTISIIPAIAGGK